MTKYTDRIIIDPNIMLGKPIVKNTRITVELILKRLSEGQSIESLQASYPHLSEEDIYACLTYASNVIANEEIIIPISS